MGTESYLKMRTDLVQRLLLKIFNEIDEAEPLDSEKSVKPRVEFLLKTLLEYTFNLRIKTRSAEALPAHATRCKHLGSS